MARGHRERQRHEGDRRDRCGRQAMTGDPGGDPVPPGAELCGDVVLLGLAGGEFTVRARPMSVLVKRRVPPIPVDRTAHSRWHSGREPGTPAYRSTVLGETVCSE